MGDVDVMLAAIDQLAGGGALSIEHGRSLVGVLHVASLGRCKPGRCKLPGGAASREWLLNATGGLLRHNQLHWRVRRHQPGLCRNRHPVLLVLDHVYALSPLRA